MSWSVSARADEDIETLLRSLQNHEWELSEAAEAPGIVLLHQIIVDPGQQNSRLCENLIVEVRDPKGIPAELLQPRPLGPEELNDIRAFVRRQSDYRRLDAAAITHDPVEGAVRRRQVEIDWGEIQAGDVVGWSMVTSTPTHPEFVPIRLGEHIPILLASLSVHSDEAHSYQARLNAISERDATIRRENFRDRRPMDITVRVYERPSVEFVPDVLPWPRDYPWMGIHLNERMKGIQYYRADDSPRLISYNSHRARNPDWERRRPRTTGWWGTGGWNQTVLALGSEVRSMAEGFNDFDDEIHSIVGMEISAAGMTQRVCLWIRDEVELINDPGHLRNAHRDISEVFRSRRATEFEKVLLMAVILEKLRIPAPLAGIRRAELGEINPHWPTMQQFSDFAVRTDDYGASLYWAPQREDCAPGEVPASWHGADVVTYEYEAVGVAVLFQDDLLREAVATRAHDLSLVQDKIRQQPWTVFTKVDATTATER